MAAASSLLVTIAVALLLPVVGAWAAPSDPTLPEVEALGGVAQPVARLPAPGEVLAYYRASTQPHVSFALFAAAAGMSYQVEAAALPTDLGSYEVVVLMLNGEVTPTERAALAAYAALGGNLVLVVDYAGFAGAAIGALNAVAEEAGTTLRFTGGLVDVGFHDTSNVGRSTITLGVSTVRYAAASGVDAGELGHALVSDDDRSAVIVAAQQVGLGYVVLVGDSNIFSQFHGGGYEEADNDVLAVNIAHGLVALGIPGL